MTTCRRSFRLSLREVGFLVAILAVLFPAGVAEAKKKKVKLPVVSSVRPLQAAVGDALTLHGKNFRPGRGKNQVVFKRDGAKAVFVKADVATRRQIKVIVPESLVEFMTSREGEKVPTKFALRVLAARFSKRYTKSSESPLIGPKKADNAPDVPGPSAPDGDCDGDKVLNSVETDDDDDLMTDDHELRIGTSPCKIDTDGDSVHDGYEYRSAVDLNDDEYQEPNKSLPYPGARPYPNPLDAADRDVDYDGDALTLVEEFRLWRFTISQGAARTLDGLTYSDGLQHSVFRVASDGRRKPNLSAAGYSHQQNFLNWAQGAGYQTVHLNDPSEWWYEDRSPFHITDFDRDGKSNPQDYLDGGDAVTGFLHARAEATYYDADQDSWLDDGERDEDSDGLTNFDETHGCMMDHSYWGKLYSKETPYGVKYPGTRLDEADTDGDGVRDGADDQDHDDLPNVMECSRQAASGREYDPMDEAPDPPNPEPRQGHVNPFNPCLPSTMSRTCNRNPSLDNIWAPFNARDKYYYVWN